MSRKGNTLVEALRARALQRGGEPPKPAGDERPVLPFSFGERDEAGALLDLVEGEVNRRVQRMVNRKLNEFRAEVAGILVSMMLRAAQRDAREPWRQ